jgi:hypothetical protein
VIFKGMTFRPSRAIGFRNSADGGPYAEFFYRRSGRTIPLDGHSRTNMAYAKDGRVLLAHDGQVYTSRDRR